MAKKARKFTTQELQTLIDGAVKSREQGNINKALSILEGVKSTPDLKNEHTLVFYRAWGEIFVCYKHLFESGGRPKKLLTVMEGTCREAIASTKNPSGKIPATHKRYYALFNYRLGDVLMASCNFEMAYKYYRIALNALPPKDPQRIEFLSKLALANIQSHVSEGLDQFSEALALQATTPAGQTPEHNLIIISGIHLNIARAYLFLGHNEAAKENLKQAKILAFQLARKYNMRKRMVESLELEEELRGRR